MSRSRVFITLGRSGQVVERGGTVSENYREITGPGPRPGRKRHTFGAYPDGSLVSSKRLRILDKMCGIQMPKPLKGQRGTGAKWGFGSHQKDAMQLTPNDLRLKLMRRRRLSKQISYGLVRKKIGLHENLLESTRPSASNNRLQLRPEAKGSLFLEKISSTQNAGIVHQVDSMRNLNSSSIVNGFEVESPDSLLRSSRWVTPPRNYYGAQQYPSIRANDALTSKPFLGDGVLDASRPTVFTTAAFQSTAEIVKPATQLSPMNGIEEKISQGKEPVSGLLHSLGLGKYEIIFRAEEVDMMALKQMAEKELKDIGIPMGPRKKILLALAAQSKQQPSLGQNVKQFPRNWKAL